MKKQVHSKLTRSAGKLFSLCFFLSAAFLSTGAFVYADKFEAAAKSASEGIQASASGATRWIIAGIMVVTGLIFLVGTQQQKEHTKGEIFMKLVGVAVIVCAIPLSGIIFGWF
ncbi:hypothetical protein OBO34_11100 [Clostridiales Family XIII bacterium ASD5510]|uniref:Conjugal transfer protein TrbC n=1 Tax=Hominibacterium faecale TaxID=2839743 RepID=A0A9J6QW62_9FIRM|nr:hypothetical protein [Hominibacterium faecale]MCU7378902.1 hypothetical protein [Hominibacterium faecale]